MGRRTMTTIEARAMSARAHRAPSARAMVLRDLSRELRDGTWDPIGDDLRLRDEFAYPADSTPSAIELLSREA